MSGVLAESGAGRLGRAGREGNKGRANCAGRRGKWVVQENRESKQPTGRQEDRDKTDRESRLLRDSLSGHDRELKDHRTWDHQGWVLQDHQIWDLQDHRSWVFQDNWSRVLQDTGLETIGLGSSRTTGLGWDHQSQVVQDHWAWGSNRSTPSPELARTRRHRRPPAEKLQSTLHPHGVMQWSRVPQGKLQHLRVPLGKLQCLQQSLG